MIVVWLCSFFLVPSAGPFLVRESQTLFLPTGFLRGSLLFAFVLRLLISLVHKCNPFVSLTSLAIFVLDPVGRNSKVFDFDFVVDNRHF